MSKYLLGVDVGTTSLKVAIIDEDAKLIALGSHKYALITPEQNSVQIDAQSMWHAFVHCTENLKAEHNLDLSKVAGISISSLCPGLVALDDNGEVLVNPIIYSDRRSVQEAEMILEAVGPTTLFAITANGSMAGAFSGSSMLWIKRHMPDEYSKTKYFGHLNTYLVNKMTGKFAIDYSNASYSNLFVTTGRTQAERIWSDELCDKIGIDREKLPELHNSTDVVGELINQDLIALGIPKGTPVAAGGADTPCATLVAGVVKAGDVCESVGTTDVLTVCIDRPVFDRAFINRCHVVPDTWIYQGAMSFTGAANEWFLRQFYTELITDKKADASLEGNLNLTAAFRAMNHEAELAEPGCGGVVFLPYMLGERSPIWDPYARGVFLGISLHTTKREMNRAVLEGCGYGLRQMCQIAERITGNKINKFSSIGGGAKSEVWAQIKADITGRDITVLDIHDMAPIGAALLAGVGVGAFKDVYEASSKVEKSVYKEFKPSHAHDDIYAKRYGTYLSMYPALKDIFRNNI